MGEPRSCENPQRNGHIAAVNDQIGIGKCSIIKRQGTLVTVLLPLVARDRAK